MDTWTTHLSLFACSWPQGVFAMRQSGAIVLWCLSLCLAMLAAILIGNYRRVRFSWLMPTAIFTLVGATALAMVSSAGGTDCGHFARGVGYVTVGVMATLCAAEFLYYRTSRRREAELRRQRQRLRLRQFDPAQAAAESDPAAEAHSLADDAVPLNPVPLLTDRTGAGADVAATGGSTWDAAAASVEQAGERAAVAGRGQWRLKLRTAKLLLAPPIGLLAGLLAFVLVPSVLAPDGTYFDVAMTRELRYLAQCQQKLYATQGSNYAGSMRRLQASGIPHQHFSLQSAFEPNDNNGDAERYGVLPAYGYRLKMLHGTVTQPMAWCLNNDPEIVQHWAAIARRDRPANRVRNQLLIHENGRLFRHPEPAAGEPGYQTFLLDALPDGVLLADGSVDPKPLAALGWTEVRDGYEFEDFENE